MLPFAVHDRPPVSMKPGMRPLVALLCCALAEGWVSSVARPLRSPHAPRESFRRARVAVRAEGDEAGHGERPISSEWELD